MTYKIGLLAAHGTGKTALAHLVAGALKKKGFRVRVLPEVATEAIETGKKINENTTLLDQTWILLKQALYEVEAELAKYDVVICDRTVHDNYCYLARACGENASLLSFVLGHASEHPYTVLYYLPILQPPRADGVRALSDSFQKEIATRIRLFLETHRVPHAVLPEPDASDGEREAWVQRIVTDTIHTLGKKELQTNLVP